MNYVRVVSGRLPGVYSCEIVNNDKLTDSVYDMTVLCPEISCKARAGQFVSVKCGEERLLRRPISICGADGGKLRFVFEVKGEGTKWLSGRAQGQTLDILGPLGNGFDISDGNIIVVGGGVGSPPLLYAAASSKGVVTAVLGFRDSGRIILENEFRAVCDSVYITTDDGSRGFHGTVTAPLTGLLESGGFGAVFACGPRAMLSPVAEICEIFGVPCQVSLEERMGCGVGACVVCACATVKGGAQYMSRVCKDGPVFDAREVVW